MNGSAIKSFSLLIIFFLFSCALDEPEQFYSPESGFLQIFISSDNSDTSIGILGTDYSVSDKDSMDLLVYQGKAYDLDSNYAILYNSINAWRQEENVYNILDWDVDSGYRSFEIFETHLPPSEYNLISIGLIASVLNIGPYRIPVSLPQDVEGTASIPVDFSIFEGGVTRINLSIKPFESMSRYQDSYVFDRIIEVESVNYYDEDFYNQIITDNN